MSTASLQENILARFAGRVVRKDLTKLVKGNAIVPTYVLEYLLGQYCATDEEATIQEGLTRVKEILARHFVHRDEAEAIKSTVRERGTHRIIDKLSANLNDAIDQYQASFANLGLRGVALSDHFIKQHPKLLGGGVWCIITLGYRFSEESSEPPWFIEALKPIQIANIDVEDYKAARKAFSREAWMDVLLQSVGLNPEAFSFRSRMMQLARLVPFVENNYNLIELGPKGTGKSHVYSEMSPHGMLISGGEVTKAKLFVNNSTGKLGLVGYWDVVAYDEFAGKQKRVDRALVDIMKNYMANKNFSRGQEVHGASASMVFMGNTDHSVGYMLAQSDLFDALPRDYHNTAFLDRLHAYLPGWEIQKLRNEMFTDGFGFIVDYLAEVFRTLRREDYNYAYERYFCLSDSITTRDKNAISKTFSGLVKIIHPDGDFTREQGRDLLRFAIEARRRVKDELCKLDETFEPVNFAFQDKQTGEWEEVQTLEALEHAQNMAASAQALDFEDLGHADADGFSGAQAPVPEKLEARHQVIHDNQTGVHYNGLFGRYLHGARKMTLVDPYIRLPYQIRNLMELLGVVLRRKPEGAEVNFHLWTGTTEDYRTQTEGHFDELAASCQPHGLHFTYTFSDELHDRSLQLDNGWKIVLGRGLDIYQPSSGRYDIAELLPEKRRCKACEVTVVAWEDDKTMSS